MAVILLSFAIGRAVIVAMAMLGVDPDFLRALGLEPGDFTALYFGSGQDLATALCQLDCQWYETIWSDGYDMSPLLEPWWRRGRAPWAWFPMFPVSVRFISALLPLSATAVAYLFNGACSMAAAWLLYLMGKTHRNHRTGLIAASLFLTSPFSLYLTIPYTEALFNLLSIATLYMAYQKRWIASGLAMALLSATRPTGLFIAFAVLVIAIREVGLLRLLRMHEHTRITLAFALCPLGISLFALYLYFLHGDALGFSNMQTATWHQNEANIPFVTIFRDLFETQGEVPGLANYNATIALLGLGMAALLAGASRWPEAVFLGAIVLATTTVSTGSMPRYVLGIWPPYLLLAMLLRDRPVIPFVLPILMILGLAVFTLGWVNWTKWVG